MFSKVTRQGRLVEREVSDGMAIGIRCACGLIRPPTAKIQGVLVVMLETDLIYRARD